MNSTRAILFDLDGTLIDTTDLILACFDHSWRSVCGRSLSRHSYVSTFGIPLRQAMHLLWTANVQSNEDADNWTIIDTLLAEYRAFNLANHDTIANAFIGVQETIIKLRERQYSIGVVTSKSRELAIRGLKLFRLDGLIDAAVFLEDTERHKPDPEPILTGLDQLGVPPCESAYVGDSRFDMIAGRAAGVTTVAALWGPTPRAELKLEHPDHYACDMTALLNLFP